VAGVPIDSVESAVVAAVRMGYRIAAAQIERTERLGTRLRQAADNAAGPGADRKALDATEQLVFNTMMAGLSWFEGIASNRGNPLRRLATAEYRILGSLFGLSPVPNGSTAGAGSDTGCSRPNPVQSAPHAPADDSSSRSSRTLVRIRHAGERRAVQVRHFEMTGRVDAGQYPLFFYGRDLMGPTIEGRLIVTPQESPLLVLKISREASSGDWSAAICDPEGTQIGLIEIVL